MKHALLDTDIFSEVLKERNQAVAHAAKSYLAAFERFTISAITVMEMVEGLSRRGSFGSVSRFMNLVDASEVLDFDRKAAELAGQVSAGLLKSGRTIGLADPMIAAIAIRHSRVLVTGNVEHFQRVQALGYPLELANWRETAGTS